MQLNEEIKLLTSPFQHPVNQLNYPFLQDITCPSSSTICLKTQDYEPEGRHSQLLQADFSSSSPFFLNTQVIGTLSPNALTHSIETFVDFAEYDQQHQTAMAEKKERRMISNRESARRSRMRKKKQTEVLLSHVDRLVISNRLLSEKLIGLLEWNQKILHENSELKEKVLTHQTLLTKFLTSNLQRNNMEDVFCITNCLRAEDSTVEQKIK